MLASSARSIYVVTHTACQVGLLFPDCDMSPGTLTCIFYEITVTVIWAPLLSLSSRMARGAAARRGPAASAPASDRLQDLAPEARQHLLSEAAVHQHCAEAPSGCTGKHSHGDIGCSPLTPLAYI